MIPLLYNQYDMEIKSNIKTILQGNAFLFSTEYKKPISIL